MAAPEGNEYSSKNNRLWANTLRRIAVQNPERLRRIAEKLYDDAEAGDKAAIKEIGDRLDGKPAQAIVGEDDNPLRLIQRIERVIVSPEDKDR